MLTISGGFLDKNYTAPNNQTITINAGTGSGAPGGDINLGAGAAPSGENTGNVTIFTRNSAGTGISAGSINLQVGDADSDGTPGAINLLTQAGQISLATADAQFGDTVGGDITLSLGAGHGAGRHGQLLIVNCPTSDPHVLGAVWNDTGTLKISGG